MAEPKYVTCPGCGSQELHRNAQRCPECGAAITTNSQDGGPRWWWGLTSFGWGVISYFVGFAIFSVGVYLDSLVFLLGLMVVGGGFVLVVLGAVGFSGDQRSGRFFVFFLLVVLAPVLFVFLILSFQ